MKRVQLLFLYGIFSLSCAVGILAQDTQPTNPEYTLSIEVPCGETIEGTPGSDYDDGTGGGPHFQNGRPGRTWKVILTRANSNYPEDGAPTLSWEFALGGEGGLTITDITIAGTIGCKGGDGPGCLGRGSSYSSSTFLTGPPDGTGPQTEENRGAMSSVLLGTEGPFHSMRKSASWTVAQFRVFSVFPLIEGETFTGRIYFTTRIGRFGVSFSPMVSLGLKPVTPIDGNPPLKLEDCAVIFKAVMPAAFVRCDADGGGEVDISDPIRALGILFLGEAGAPCPAALDCNGDGEFDITDPIAALAHEFLGGPQPPSPFPACGREEGLQPADCPKASTSCP